MKPEAFVKAFHIEKQQFLKEYLSDSSKSDAGQLIKSLHLDAQQTDILKKILDSSFTDIFYTILLGLDGCNPIGDLEQQQFTVLDKNGNQVCWKEQLGEVEAYAFEYFHENNER